jgi:arsenical pump membrane protein
MHAAASAAGQVWPAFVLVTGLLLVGVVAERDGLFAAAGARVARLPVGPWLLYAAALALVAAVTAVLNLDTSVFFLTPVLIHVARSRGLDEAPFLYGAVFMSNAGSLFLPGSNLTNLIVLHNEPVAGRVFFTRFLPAALGAVAITTLYLLVAFSRTLRPLARPPVERMRARIGVGAAGVVAATLLVLVLANPAPEVLAVGAAAVLASRVSWKRVTAAVDLRVLGGLFALAVVLGAVGRWWNGPASFVNGLDSWATAAAAAIAAVCVNNLPAAVLLTPHPPHHARALLIGLNLGPNLAVTGSLSAFLWLRVARLVEARPSARTYSLLGLGLVPLSIAAALAASAWL